MHHCLRSGWRYGQNFLIDVLLGGLHEREGLRQLVFLVGELILIGRKLLYAAPNDGKIERSGLKLRLQLRRRYGGSGRGSRWQPAERRSPSPDHLAAVGLPSKRAPDTDENCNGKASKRAK